MLMSYFRVCILWVSPLTTDIGEMLKQTNWSLCWLNPKICQFLIQFSILNCFCGNCFRDLSFWPSARSSTLLMLASIRALRTCMNDQLPAISQTAWYCQSYQFFLFKHFIPSIFNCLKTSCTNLLLHNLCWLANILSKICLQRWNP